MTKLVGIVNLTPDSFSDGGNYMEAGHALAHIQQLISDGADVIDIGAESTRPGATPLMPSEEWARLEPVLAELERFSGASVEFSVDTRHVPTARKSLDCGVHWINDVSGLQNPDMLRLIAGTQANIVCMHSLGVPADKQKTLPHDADVMETLFVWIEQRLRQLLEAGIDSSRIIFDPGIGFGKAAQQSMQIIRDIRAFHVLGIKLMVGHSRKSFLGIKPSHVEEEGRAGGKSNAPLPLTPSLRERENILALDTATLAVSKYLISQEVQYLRVHNVALHKELL